MVARQTQDKTLQHRDKEFGGGLGLDICPDAALLLACGDQPEHAELVMNHDLPDSPLKPRVSAVQRPTQDAAGNVRTAGDEGHLCTECALQPTHCALVLPSNVAQEKEKSLPHS